MNERAHRLFNLYAGEGKQALFFAIMAFVLFFASSLGYKYADTLFVTTLNASNLPYAYGCIALSLIGAVSLIIYAYNRYSPTTVFYSVLIAAIALYGTISILLITNVVTKLPALAFILKVTNQITYIQLLSCFWTFIDQYYHFQDAKRLYTLFNSSIYLGLTCTGLLIQTSAFDAKQIFLLIFLLLSIVYFISKKVTLQFDIVPDDSEVEATSADNSIKRFAHDVIASRFTLYLMAASLVLYLLLTTTEIGYLTSFQRYFGIVNSSFGEAAPTRAFTRFYGTALAIVGACNLLTGWFFYSRMVLRFGVNMLVLITPIGFLLTYGGWSFDNSLLFPLLGFFVAECLYPVIEDNNFNLLLNAVPLQLKSKVRVVIESFSEPTGMLLSSILLTSAFISWKFLGLGLALIALMNSLCVRSEYYKAIFNNLKNHALHLHKTAKEWLATLNKKERKLSEERLLHLLEHPDPEFQMLSCEAIFATGKVDLIKKAHAYSDQLSVAAKIHLLNLVEKTPYKFDPFVIDAINRWQDESSNLELQAAIDFYLAKSGLLHPEKAQYNLNSPYPLQKAAAIMALQHSFAHQSLQEVASNRMAAIEEMQRLLESENEDELILGIRLLGIDGSQQNIEILIDYLRHPSLIISKNAATALQECIDSYSLRHAKTIIEQIRQRNDSEFRIACLRALFKIGDTSLVRPMIQLSTILRPNEVRHVERLISDLGLKTVPALVGIVVDTSLADRCRIIAGKILAQLSLPQLSANLYDIIAKEIERAYFYFYYAHTLPQQYEGHDLRLLKEGLLSNFQSVINFIIQLLGASRWIEDCELIAFSLRSKSSKIRSQAIETLEMCCERSIFRLLYPLIGDLPFQEKLASCEKFAATGLSLAEVLEKMSRTSNTLDLILATTWKYRLDLPNWRTALRKQMASREEIFHHFAYELLET